MGGDGRTAESAWTPLSHPIFRALWIASLVSNIGTWMQNVSAAARIVLELEQRLLP